MVHRGPDGRGILLLVASSGIALLSLLAAACLLLYAAVSLFLPGNTPAAPDQIQAVILASAAILIGTLAFVAAFHGLRDLGGEHSSAIRPRSLSIWQALLLLIGWVGASWLAQFLVNKDQWKWLAPVLYVSAIGIPVYFLIRLAAAGLVVGSPRRFWGLITAGMFLGTSLSALAEMAVVILGLVAGIVYLSLRPGEFAVLQQLAVQIGAASGINETLSALGPWLDQPLVFALALFFFAGFSPAIEECAKSLAVWTIFDRLKSPTEGFLAGALSGAGFGLLESLLASATPDQDWGLTLILRGGSTLMHIMAASLTGWSIGSFRASRNPARLAGGYALAILIHGLWNASVVSLAFGGLRTTLHGVGEDRGGSALITGGSAVLAVLCVAILVALVRINRKLRSVTSSAPLAAGFPPSGSQPPSEVPANNGER
jgi:RsiW-degrading membrane proteinase PrsW (M82 family)